MPSDQFLQWAPSIKGLLGVERDNLAPERGFSTLLARGASGIDPATGAVSCPIYQSATFVHPGFEQSTGFGYSRYGNPTRLELENTVALLEQGKKAWAFSSGMAAISTVAKLFHPGDHILVSDDLYGGIYRLFHDVYGPLGLDFEFLDTTDVGELRRRIRKNTRGLFIETPSNPTMKVTDLAAAAEAIHGNRGIFIVDNTFLSPYFQQPLRWGADVVVHSATKYLGGHNDLLAGLVVTANDELIEPLFMLAMSEGGPLGPFDSWLLLRSLKTLGLRLERQQANAQVIFRFLRGHPKVDKVYFVGDPDHPGYPTTKKQTSGFGAMISFSVLDPGLVPQVLNRLKLILFAESLGGVESLMTYPLGQTHGAIPEALRNRLGITNRLLRLSVGIEDVQDLIGDLSQALDAPF